MQRLGPAASAMPGYSPTNASLYVGDLAPSVAEPDLYALFNVVGSVSSIRVCRDAMTRRSLGYAYVNFHSPQDAERAIEALNFSQIKGRACRIMWSQRDPYLRKSGKGNIFVKNLHESVDHKMLYDTFSLFGDILSCKVAVDQHGKSKGYGYVHFTEEESAKKAIDKVNGMTIEGLVVYVGPFQRRNERRSASEWTNCYIKNLPEDWKDEKLGEVVGAYGEVQSAKVMTNPDGTSKRFGFVNFAEPDHAKACVDALNGVAINDDGSLNLEDKDSTFAASSRSKKDDDSKDGEETKSEGAKGEGDDAAKASADETKTEGATAEAGAADEDAKDDKPFVRRLFVGRAQKKSERMRELREQYEARRQERLSKFQGVNLYVKNLDDTVDDARLREEFSKHGTITSAHVMKDRKGVSKGFGFVCFATPEDANKAVEEMNGAMIGAKPIYVALAQRKEVRRAQMEAQYGRGGGVGRGGLVPQYPGMGAGMQPMYYQGMQGYPMPGVGMPQGFPGPQGFGMPAAFGMAAAGPAGRRGGGRGGGGRGGGPAGRGGGPMVAGGRGMPGGYAGGMPGGAPGGYAGAAGMAPQGRAAPPAPAAQMPAAPGPLTAAALAAASQQDRMNMIGERLYPLVERREPQAAAKITGMLLEMDQSELLNLLESPEALNDKINEALHVLKTHSG